MPQASTALPDLEHERTKAPLLKFAPGVVTCPLLHNCQAQLVQNLKDAGNAEQREAAAKALAAHLTTRRSSDTQLAKQC